MIKEITTYLKTLLGTSWVIGVNLFAGFAPSTAIDDCLIVIESGGTPNFFLTDRQEKTVQIISRATNYFTAMTNARSAYTSLHGKAGITMVAIEEDSNQYVNTIEAISLPQSLGQDENGFYNISTNYVFKLEVA